MQIVIIDDEFDFLEILKEEFERRNCEVLSACNGLEGLGLLRQNSDVDVILSDINMPVMDGIRFLKAVKAEFRNIPIFMMTGNPDYSEKSIQEYGAQALLRKPLIPYDVILNSVMMSADSR